MNMLTIFCQVDDFCQVFEPKLNEQMPADGKRKRIKPSKMSRSEVMTILIAFHTYAASFGVELLRQHRCGIDRLHISRKKTKP